MRIAEPVLPLQMESAISLKEALSMAQSDESALEAYRFCTGSAAGWVLEKGEYKACSFLGCRLTGAHLSKSWLRDVVFERCELSGLRLMESTLQRVRFVNCKFSGANLAGASLQDVLFQNCTADGLMLPESRLKNGASCSPGQRSPRRMCRCCLSSSMRRRESCCCSECWPIWARKRRTASGCLRCICSPTASCGSALSICAAMHTGASCWAFRCRRCSPSPPCCWPVFCCMAGPCPN